MSIKNGYISIEIGNPSVKFAYFLPPRHVLSYNQVPTTTATVKIIHVIMFYNAR